MGGKLLQTRVVEAARLPDPEAPLPPDAEEVSFEGDLAAPERDG